MSRHDAIIGSLLCTAVGDALGLPFEGLSRRRIARMKPGARYRLVFSHGMVSDDTDHAAAVVHALAISAGDPEQFERALARGLRRWFLALPAGVGLASAKACIRMCLGSRRPGVFSAGNGPSMRAPVLGAAIDDMASLVELVRRSTALTHTDPRAFHGALAVAMAARHLRSEPMPSIAAFMDEFRGHAAGLDPAFASELDACVKMQGATTEEFAVARGHTRGVGGFIVHSVPVSLHAAFAHADDPVGAALACIVCGGDTDTTAAVAAGIVGARSGATALPAALVSSLWDWPRGTRRLEEWAAAATGAIETRTPICMSEPVYPLCLARNLFFLGVVLAHAGRRALPPY